MRICYDGGSFGRVFAQIGCREDESLTSQVSINISQPRRFDGLFFRLKGAIIKATIECTSLGVK